MVQVAFVDTIGSELNGPAGSATFPDLKGALQHDRVCMFNYDWFHGPAYTEQKDEARRRCVASHFPDAPANDARLKSQMEAFRSELHLRTLIYLRDGFSYEVRELAQVSTRSHLVFECEPVDEHYKVGAFVVTVPFDEIVRVEVFAVHPSEKPDDLPQITGFRNHPDGDSPAPEPKHRKPGR